MLKTNNPHNILQVLPRLISGGVERGTLEIAEALTARGWGAMVASDGGALASTLAKYSAKHFAMPLTSKNPFTMWHNALGLNKLIKDQKIELIHARSRAPAWSARMAARWAGVPFITTFHGHYSTNLPFKKFYNSIMTKGERVIAISEFTAQHISETYGIDNSIIRVIPRGVDLRFFNPEQATRERVMVLLNQWKLPEDKPVLLMPARFTDWKGHEILVDALAMLPHRDFICLMLGEQERHSDYRRRVEKRVIARDLGGYVRFMEPVRDMTSAYTIAHTVICPSVRPEAFGRVPAEAGAMERPVIAFNHGGVRETILPGKSGWLVEPFTAEALSKAIWEALKLTDAERAVMGAAGRRHIAENYTTDNMCRLTLELYDEVITEWQLRKKQ